MTREATMTAVFKDGYFIGHVIWSGKKFEAPVNNTYLCNHQYYAQSLPITEFYLFPDKYFGKASS